MLLAALLANAGHHRALHAADDVGAIIELLDHPDHGLNLRLGGAGLHYNDHSSVPPVRRRGHSSARRERDQAAAKVEIAALASLVLHERGLQVGPLAGATPMARLPAGDKA